MKKETTIIHKKYATKKKTMSKKQKIKTNCYVI